MLLKLTAAQRRVLGVLIEKSRTTPQSYPLTLNAILVGCNQLSCREPVMTLNEDAVARALRELGMMKLVVEEPGSRVERYRHNVEESLRWNEYQQSLMAELLLRGPQTAGELKSNASRMSAFPDLDSVSMLIDDFTRKDPPLVRELPRQPGKSACRFDHLFYDEASAPTVVATIVPTSTLEARVTRLEAELVTLKKAIEEFLRAGR